MLENEVGYIVYKQEKDGGIKISETVYSSYNDADDAIRKNASKTRKHIDSYGIKKVFIDSHSIIKPKGSYLLEADNMLHNLCGTIENLGGCYIFKTHIDETNSFYIDFECNNAKSIGIISRSINEKYKSLNFHYTIEVLDFDFIKKNDRHSIYYRLYTHHDLSEESKIIEDINIITGNINYWNSPAFIAYFNGEI